MRFVRALLFVGMIAGFASGFAHLFIGGHQGHCHRPPAAAQVPVAPELP